MEPIHERTLRLRALMKEHKLKGPAVATILNRTPDTVRKWRNGYRVIPSLALELLEVRVRVRAANDAALNGREAISA